MPTKPKHYDPKTTYDEVNGIVAEYLADRDKAERADYARAMAALAPGMVAPRRDPARLYTDRGRADLAAARANADALIEAERARALAAIAAETCAAPPADALAVLGLMQGRRNVTPAELDSYVNMWGEWPAARAAIADAAKTSKSVTDAERPRWEYHAPDAPGALADYLDATKRAIREYDGGYPAMMQHAIREQGRDYLADLGAAQDLADALAEDEADRAAMDAQASAEGGMTPAERDTPRVPSGAYFPAMDATPAESADAPAATE